MLPAETSKDSAYERANQHSVQIHRFIGRVKDHFHLVYWISPTGTDFKKKLREFPGFLYHCTVLYFQDLPHDAFESLGAHFLAEAELDPEIKHKLILAAEDVYQSARRAALRFFDET